MKIALAVAALTTMLGVTLGWRHRGSAVTGAVIGAAMLALGGLIDGADVLRTALVLWRPLLTVTSVMVMTACALHVGLFGLLAQIIEPRTRGPVRHAFHVVFALSAVTASLLSNDAAILVLTPTVITLLRAVYPRRHPKFTLAFSFAVFYAAGVAPLVTGNPMNIVVAGHAGIGFNQYAVRMIPIAVLGWFIAHYLLARAFAEELRDEAPALGAWPAERVRLGASGVAVLVAMGAVLLAYPVISYLDGPLWAVAVIGATLATIAAVDAPRAVRLDLDGEHVLSNSRSAALHAIAKEVSWELLPLLAAVLLVASGLAKAGVVDALAALYRDGSAPLPTVGVISALGAAAINNHPAAILGTLAIERAGGDPSLTLACLIGGDLGPRLLPIGSLAGLMWMSILRRHDVEVSVGRFIKLGVVVTIPCLTASLLLLWLLEHLS